MGNEKAVVQQLAERFDAEALKAAAGKMGKTLTYDEAKRALYSAFVIG